MAQRIKLTGKRAVGKHEFAIVDDDEYVALAEFRWMAMRSGTGPIYAVRTYRTAAGKVFERMHRVVAKAGPNDVVDHLNRDTLDNRRDNLRVGTQRDNSLNREQREEQRQCRQCGQCFVARGLAGSVKAWYCSDACRRRRDVVRTTKAKTDAANGSF